MTDAEFFDALAAAEADLAPLVDLAHVANLARICAEAEEALAPPPPIQWTDSHTRQAA